MLVNPNVTRARVVLEIAAELVSGADQEFQQVRKFVERLPGEQVDIGILGLHGRAKRLRRALLANDDKDWIRS